MPRGGTRTGAGRKPATFTDCIVTVNIPGRNAARLIISRPIIERLYSLPDPGAALTDALTRAFDRKTRRRCTGSALFPNLPKNSAQYIRCPVFTARRDDAGRPLCSKCSARNEIESRIL